MLGLGGVLSWLAAGHKRDATWSEFRSFFFMFLFISFLFGIVGFVIGLSTEPPNPHPLVQ